MKRFLVFPILLITCLITVSGCRYLGRGVQGSGNHKSEKRELASFKSIDATGAYEINVTCQQSQSFEIEGDDNILPMIKTVVNGDVLRIYNENRYNSTRPITIRIAVPDLEKLSSEGAGDIHLANVKNDKLILSSTGAANIEASGQTKSVEISSNGAGNVDTNKLIAERAKVTVSGAGNIDVYASQQLDVSVSGIGNVTYSGNPPVVNKSVSGIGSVNKKE